MKVITENPAVLWSFLLQLPKMRSLDNIVAIILLDLHHVGVACTAGKGCPPARWHTCARQRILDAVEDLNDTPNGPKGGTSHPSQIPRSPLRRQPHLTKYNLVSCGLFRNYSYSCSACGRLLHLKGELVTPRAHTSYGVLAVSMLGICPIFGCHWETSLGLLLCCGT